MESGEMKEMGCEKIRRRIGRELDGIRDVASVERKAVKIGMSCGLDKMQSDKERREKE